MAHTTYGTCLYLEFTKDSTTAQMIIVPEHARMGDAGQGTQPLLLLHRRQDKLKGETRQPWKFSPAEAYTLGRRKPDPKTSLFPGGGSLVDAVNAAHDLYNPVISSHLESLISAQFTLVQEPVLVEISPMEIQALDSNKRPEGLISRVSRARLEHGFPKELWAERYQY